MLRPAIRLSNGELGCMLSHYEIWCYMAEWIAICCIYEDDIKFIKTIMKDLTLF